MQAFNFITDRTYTDVLRWNELREKNYADFTAEEKAEWDAGMKGCYNASDMNRVQEAVEAISSELLKMGYWHKPIATFPAWDASSVPRREDFEAYYENIRSLRNAIWMPPDTPGAPSITRPLDTDGANAIERILEALIPIIARVEAFYFHSGDLYAGDV